VRQWIDPLPDQCRGVNVEQLRIDARTVHEKLLAVGSEGIGAFDSSLFKQVQYEDGGRKMRDR
jgi:hypothetical protein